MVYKNAVPINNYTHDWDITGIKIIPEPLTQSCKYLYTFNILLYVPQIPQTKKQFYIMMK